MPSSVKSQETCDGAPSQVYSARRVIIIRALSGVGDVLVLPVTHARNSPRLPRLLYTFAVPESIRHVYLQEC